MIKRDITFEDFDGNLVTETHYFNLNKSELVELQVSEHEGYSEMLKRIVEADDNKEILAVFKRFILMSYGKREGTSFVKSPEMALAFSQSLAYDALFIEIASDSDNGTKMAEFLNGIVPKEVREAMALGVDTPAEPAKQLPPPPPAV